MIEVGIIWVLLEVRVRADGAGARHLGVAGVLGVDAAEKLQRKGTIRTVRSNGNYAMVITSMVITQWESPQW